MKNKDRGYIAFEMDQDTYMEVIKLALKHGKKPGESIIAEFKEVLRKKNSKIKFLGFTDQDVDMLTGNLREQGFKIYNPHEEERRKKLNDKNKGEK